MSDIERKASFICEVCGKSVPDNSYWRTWAAFIGEICKKCRLEEISKGIDR